MKVTTSLFIISKPQKVVLHNTEIKRTQDKFVVICIQNTNESIGTLYKGESAHFHELFSVMTTGLQKRKGTFSC